MKAITVWQPWAQLIAVGAKRYETRGWPTDYRGPVAIHAGARWLADNAGLCWRSTFREALESAGVRVPGVKPVARRFKKLLPLGAVVAVAELVDCVPCWPIPDGIDRREAAFGDWGPARFAFRLADPFLLPEPVPAVGMQGMFTLAERVREAVEAQLQGVADGR